MFSGSVFKCFFYFFHKALLFRLFLFTIVNLTVDCLNDGAVVVLVVGEAFHAVVDIGHNDGVGVQEIQELQGLIRVLGRGGDGHHRALTGGAVHVSGGRRDHAHVNAAGLGEVQLTAEGVGLGAEQVVAGGLAGGAVVVCSGDGLAARGDEALLRIVIGAVGELLEFVGGKLVDDGAADVLGRMLGVIVVGRQMPCGGTEREERRPSPVLRD